MTPTNAEAAAFNPGYAARFAALKRRFVAGLPARWSAIALASGGSDVQRAELHRLAGAAGSFGYTALGDAARVAERSSTADSGSDLSTLHALLLETIRIEPAM